MAPQLRPVPCLLLGFYLCATTIAASLPAHTAKYGLTTGLDPSASSRQLLQLKTKCSVDFQYFNYTPITSVCQAPDFPASQCCTALIIFLCPYAEQFNDDHTDCATTFFSYLNLAGNYPAGLFANECTDFSNPKGLTCPSAPAPAPSEAYSLRTSTFEVLMILSTALFWWRMMS